jgi:uncharacterized protein
MILKLKLPFSLQVPSMAVIRDGVKLGARKLIEPLTKPYIGPVLALTAFLGSVIAFLSLSGDPEAATPNVRIKLAKTAIEESHGPSHAQNQTINDQGFTMDASGMFEDVPVSGFNLNDTNSVAVITLPNDEKALTTNPKQGPVSPLAKAPITGMIQNTSAGPLPMISPTGMAAASAYARPFVPNGKPTVALIVGGLGLNAKTTKEAIETLPPEVTLSFVPYANNLQTWVDLARSFGHEVLIEVPMQPSNYPANDPGPQTLLAGAKPEDIQNKLNWALGRMSGYFGVINYQGDAFFKDRNGVKIFGDTLKQRGIAFVDDGTARDISAGWSRATVNRVIDNQINVNSIKAQLNALEATAKTKGSALGNGFAYPVTLAVAQVWAEGLSERGLQLAPASALLH